MKSRRVWLHVLVIFATVVPAVTALAQPCETYGDYAHWVTSTPLESLGGSARDVAIVGNFAYVANGNPGLVVVDVSDPTHLEVRGQVDTPWVAWRLAAAGSLVYVADDDGGFQIVDVADPDLPVLRGRVSSFGDAYDVALTGHHAYVAASGNGVVVIDVADPDQPLLVRTVDTVGYAYGVCVAGDRLYVADSWNGLLIYDLADPTLPVLLGGYDTAGSANQVQVSGDHALVADHSGGLVILNVADPANIAPVATLPTRSDAWDVALSPNGVLVVAAAGLGVFAATDLTQVESRGNVPCGDDALGVAVMGDWAFVADDEEGLAVYDISVAATAEGIGASLVTPGYAVGIDVANGHAFMGSQTSGLQVFSLADPSAPTLVTTLPVPGFPGDVAIVGNLGYLTCYTSGLQIVDVTDPAAPSVLGELVTGAPTRSLAYQDGRIYMTEEDSLRVIDVGDPAAPTSLRTVAVPGAGVGVNDRGVFVGTTNGELHWFTDSTSGLVLIDDIYLPGSGNDVAVLDTLVFAACSSFPSSRLAIVAASPGEGTLTMLAQVPLPRMPAGVTLDRGLAYVADGVGGVQIVDVHDPLHPVLLGAAAIPPNDAQAVAVAGDHLYVADLLSGLCTMPRECTEYVAVFLAMFDAVPDDGAVALTWQASVDGEIGTFHLTASLGEATWDVPLRATGTDAWSARDTNPRLTAGGEVAYVLQYREDHGEWFEVGRRNVTLAPPAAARLLEPRPNPFNPRTTIPFVLARMGEATLAVYDAAGRLVAELASGAFAAGAHEAMWNGCNDRGAAMPSGIYFARLTTDDRVDVCKLALLR